MKHQFQFKWKVSDIKEYLFARNKATTTTTTAVIECDASKPERETFQHASASIFLLAQCFGVMPVAGLFASNARKLRFIWHAPQTLYALLIIGICLTPVVAILKHLQKIGISTQNFRILEHFYLLFFFQLIALFVLLEGIAFYAWSELGCILFFLLAKRWPRVMRHWERTENIFLNAPYVTLPRNLIQRIRPTSYTLLLLSVCKCNLKNSEKKKLH